MSKVRFLATAIAKIGKGEKKMLNVDNLFIKYVNSSEKWLLPIPVLENGQMKLRCFMTRRKALVGTFQSIYTYDVDFRFLSDFFSYKSNGQAYNQMIKYKKHRIGFLDEPSKVTGEFTMQDVKDTVINGRTVYVLEILNQFMAFHNKHFTLEAISEVERKQSKAEYENIKDQLANLGYDY